MRQIFVTHPSEKSPRLHCFCDKVACAYFVAAICRTNIQSSLNSCDRSRRQNSVAAKMIFTCHTRRFVAATCRDDVSQRLVASCGLKHFRAKLVPRSFRAVHFFFITFPPIF